MYQTTLPTIERGTIAFCQFYDLGEEIALEWIARNVPRPMTSREIAVRARHAESIRIARQPLQFKGDEYTLALSGLELKGILKVSIYDLGAVAFTLEFPLPARPSWESIAGLMGVLQSSPASVEEIFARAVSELESAIAPAIVKPNRARSVEDYSVLIIEEFAEKKVDIPSLAGHPELRATLLGEKQSLSDYSASMLTPIGYYADDLALLSWNGAILIEPDPLAVETALELIEFANVELLMLRSYDEALDEELPRLYARLPKDPPRFAIPLVRRYSGLLHEVQRVIVEFTGVTEKVDNALKVTEDVYWNRFYSAMLTVLKVEVWRSGVEHKLELLRQTYTMLHDEADTERASALEWTIVFLIFFEIVMALVRKGS
jgi:hypothetical protein